MSSPLPPLPPPHTLSHTTTRTCLFCPQVSKGPAQRFEVLAQLVSSLFDLNPGMAGHLKTSVWKKVVINLLEMVKLLEDNPQIKVWGRVWGEGVGTTPRSRCGGRCGGSVERWLEG
jgi:hypothetical protein